MTPERCGRLWPQSVGAALLLTTILRPSVAATDTDSVQTCHGIFELSSIGMHANNVTVDGGRSSVGITIHGMRQQDTVTPILLSHSGTQNALVTAVLLDVPVESRQVCLPLL